MKKHSNFVSGFAASVFLLFLGFLMVMASYGIASYLDPSTQISVLSLDTVQGFGVLALIVVVGTLLMSVMIRMMDKAGW